MKRLVAAISLLLCLMAPATALAYNPLGGACQAGVNTSAACSPNGNGSNSTNPINSTLKKVTSIVALIAGIAAVIMIIVGGFRYITSAGDPQKASNARSIVLGAVIGLVIVAAAESIILFVLSKIG